MEGLKQVLGMGATLGSLLLDTLFLTAQGGWKYADHKASCSMLQPDQSTGDIDWEQGFQTVPADHNSGSLIFFEDYEDSCELNIVQTFEKSEGYSIKKCKFMLIAGLYLTFVPQDKDASWAAGFHGTLEATQADHSEQCGKPI